MFFFFFFFQAEDGIRDLTVTGVQTCALPILGVAPLVTGIIGRVFGLTHFNTLYGIVFLSHQVGSFFGAWMGGVVFDRFGNYNFGWGALIVIGVTAFTLQWLMDERPPRERKPSGEPEAVPA